MFAALITNSDAVKSAIRRDARRPQLRAQHREGAGSEGKAWGREGSANNFGCCARSRDGSSEIAPVLPLDSMHGLSQIDPKCIACGYSLTGVEIEASCPECGISAADRYSRESLLDSVVPDRPAAGRALLWICGAESAAAALCVAAAVCFSIGNDRALLLLWFPFAAALLVCRFQWRTLMDSMQVTRRFERLVFIRLLYLAVFVPAITIMAYTPVGLSMYGGPLLLTTYLLIAILGMLSGAGSVAEILFLGSSLRKLSASGARTVSVFGWFSLLTCICAWIMLLGGPLNATMLLLLAASYAMSAGMTFTAALLLREVDRKLVG